MDFDKQELKVYLSQWLQTREEAYISELEELRTAVANDSKSTAGDKHETGRAMNQLEQERMLSQVQIVRTQISQILRLDTELKTEQIGSGSLIETNLGIFYISAGLGQLSFKDKTIFCIGPDAPISQFLKGKSVGTYEWNGKSLVIKTIK